MSINRLHGVQLSGWDLGVTVTALDLMVNTMRANGVSSGHVFDVRDRLRTEYEAMRDEESSRASGQGSFAAKPLQVSAPIDPAQSTPDDLITAKEAAGIMGCSATNVRQRCNRETLPGIQLGGRWHLSRAALLQVVDL